VLKNNPSLILVCDTSSPNLSLALWRSGKLIGRKDVFGQKGKTHLLAAFLDQMLKKTKTPLNKIEVAAFGFGPGSYTGLRIGLASLKALLLSQPRLRAVRLESLDLIAAGIPKDRFGVVVDARREKLYCNFYKREKGILEHFSETPLLLTIEELNREIERQTVQGPLWLAGDALLRYEEPLKKLKNCHFLPSGFWYPKAKYAMPFIQHALHGKKRLRLSEIRPFYMRRSEAEEKWGLCYDKRDL
jgi:tRNA threonylcarbamoyladenosine biosynthesis protein TsaB